MTKIVLGMVAIRLSMGATAGFYYVAGVVVTKTVIVQYLK